MFSLERTYYTQNASEPRILARTSAVETPVGANPSTCTSTTYECHSHRPATVAPRSPASPREKSLAYLATVASAASLRASSKLPSTWKKRHQWLHYKSNGSVKSIYTGKPTLNESVRALRGRKPYSVEHYTFRGYGIVNTLCPPSPRPRFRCDRTSHGLLKLSSGIDP